LTRTSTFREKRHPCRSMETLIFRYRLHFGKEINRKRWVDGDVNLPVFLVDEDVNLPVFLVDEDVNLPEKRQDVV